MVAGLNNPVLDLRLATGDRRVTQFLGRLDPMRDRTGAMKLLYRSLPGWAHNHKREKIVLGNRLAGGEDVEVAAIAAKSAKSLCVVCAVPNSLRNREDRSGGIDLG
jgi:hypothetical protein